MSKRDVIRKLAGIPPDMVCEHAEDCKLDGAFVHTGVQGGRCPHAIPHKKSSGCDGACQIYREPYFCREVKDHDECNNVV